jgi:hypothetical protein
MSYRRVRKGSHTEKHTGWNTALKTGWQLCARCLAFPNPGWIRARPDGGDSKELRDEGKPCWAL